MDLFSCYCNVCESSGTSNNIEYLKKREESHYFGEKKCAIYSSYSVSLGLSRGDKNLRKDLCTKVLQGTSTSTYYLLYVDCFTGLRTVYG